VGPSSIDSNLAERGGSLQHVERQVVHRFGHWMWWAPAALGCYPPGISVSASSNSCCRNAFHSGQQLLRMISVDMCNSWNQRLIGLRAQFWESARWQLWCRRSPAFGHAACFMSHRHSHDRRCRYRCRTTDMPASCNLPPDWGELDAPGPPEAEMSCSRRRCANVARKRGSALLRRVTRRRISADSEGQCNDSSNIHRCSHCAFA
jgi:hypothetical protein